jgi:hypothetical protein
MLMFSFATTAATAHQTNASKKEKQSNCCKENSNCKWSGEIALIRFRNMKVEIKPVSILEFHHKQFQMKIRLYRHQKRYYLQVRMDFLTKNQPSMLFKTIPDQQKASIVISGIAEPAILL